MNDVEFKHYGVPGMKWGVRKFEAYKKKQKKTRQKSRDEPKKTKDEILRTGKASEVLKIKKQLSVTEMRDVVKRFELEQKLKDYSSKEIKTSMQKMDEVMKTVGKVNNWLDVGTDSYNVIASIYNATENGRRKPLSKIDKGVGNKKKKK